MATKTNFYSNPAFCQQSEYSDYPPRIISPQNIRQSPVGAQCISQNVERANHQENALFREHLEEQEFYEEVLVDDNGFITDKKFVVVAQNNYGKKYIQSPENEDRHLIHHNEERKGARYEIPTSTKPKSTRSHRYEYIQMQEQNGSPDKKSKYVEDVEIAPGRFNRYAVVEAEEETEISPLNNSRYALVPIDHLSSLTTTKQQMATQKSKHDYVSAQPVAPTISQSCSPNRYENKHNQHRYEVIQTIPEKPQSGWNLVQPSPRFSNPAATQKLHEILSTPKKHPSEWLSPQSGRKRMPSPISPIPKDYQARQQMKPPPKAQQKLNYALGARQMPLEKRHMAIVVPRCSSSVQSVYCETTFSKSGTWSNLSMEKTPIHLILALAAIIMVLCGAVSTGLCFYMIYLMERQYYLDFGIVAGFACFILGILGFRSRNVYWLPNRNYISGYIILSIFSLSSCGALLVLLIKQPKNGTPLADMTSGAVCGFSLLSLFLATTGVVSSYCCKYPPPDNRVQHCAQGFNV